ncbi:MAG: hypothetical protein RR454_03150, partial [Clostridia bacterium]
NGDAVNATDINKAINDSASALSKATDVETKANRGDFNGTNGTNGINGAKGDIGLTGAKGDKGDKGVGISTITKTGTSGLVDTYTITYEDGRTQSINITNGAKGETGTSPHIGANNNWFVGAVDTGVLAQGMNETQIKIFIDQQIASTVTAQQQTLNILGV